MRFSLPPRHAGHLRPPAFPLSRFVLYLLAAAALMHLALAA